MKLLQNQQYGLYEKDGKTFCDSLQVAETFGKRHGNVIRDIEALGCSAEFNQLNFELISYRDERNRKQPKYLMTKDGFTILTMGYSGKKAMAFKEAYIKRFNDMESYIKSMQSVKHDFPAFTNAIQQAHSEPKPYHFSNEINMIYRLVLGIGVEQFRKAQGIEQGEPIRPYMTAEQIRVVEDLQRIDIGLLISTPEFTERKRILETQRDKLIQKTALSGGK